MPKLRPRDIAALPDDFTTEQAEHLLAASYEAFCTCVVAEATRRRVPAALAAALRDPQWRDDWIDALTGAEATLQVAVLRARYEDGPHTERARSNAEGLAAVRTRLHEVRADAKRQRRGTAIPAAVGEDRAVRAATKKLIQAHPDHYEQLVAAAMAAAGVHPDMRRADGDTCAGLTRWALTVGGPVPSVTDRVRELDALPDIMLDQVVARDVQHEPEEPELAHPLLLDRWGDSLDRLARATADRLGLPHRPMAAMSDVDLTVAGLEEEAAYRRINQFRFLAHVQQRWLEQKTRVRRFRRQVADWQQATVRPPQDKARAALRRAYADEFAVLLAAVGVKAGAPSGLPNPRAASGDKPAPPQAAQVLAAKLTEAGWDARLEFEPPRGDSRGQARVDATRAGAQVRAAYKRRNKGQGGGQGWQLMFVGARLRGGDWVQMAKVSDLLDFVMLPEAEFAGQVSAYRAPDQRPRRSHR